MEASIMRWGMTIDLKRCIGCKACVLACKAEHFLPMGILWNRVLVSETGKYPTVTKIILPVRCNHCDEAKCVDACPTGATVKREDGIVTIDPDKCMGCRYCLIACPYQARSFYANGKEFFPGQGLTPFEEIGNKLYPHFEGTVEKCNFCVERIDEGLNKGLKPGVDREATPACVIGCPVEAMEFGDLDDPYSNVSKLIKEKKARPLHPEFGTEPSIFYIQ
jgi:Fe-S-cluster-containing dehydrogenase component